MPTLPDMTTAPPWFWSGAIPSDAEVARWLTVTSEENRKAWFDTSRDNAQQANQCWFQDHAARLETLQNELLQARRRITWLESHYRPAGEQS